MARPIIGNGVGPRDHRYAKSGVWRLWSSGLTASRKSGEPISLVVGDVGDVGDAGDAGDAGDGRQFDARIE